MERDNFLFTMRLDRYLSSVTILSRSQAQKAIRHGRVSLNGMTVKQASMLVPDEAEVRLDQQMLTQPGHRYFMLNKPKGYVCTTSDRHNSSVLELLDEPVLAGLHFAGRLDIDTTGLVLVTDDGAWSHRITAPMSKCPKGYLVELVAPLSEHAVARLRQGIVLRNEKKPTLPAELDYLSPQQIRLSVSEGRYHQVKRMIAAVGNRVISLQRVRIGSLLLDPSLAPGDYRSLSQLEREAVFTDCG